jgi:hypothetical protein
VKRSFFVVGLLCQLSALPMINKMWQREVKRSKVEILDEDDDLVERSYGSVAPQRQWD